jgi:hypothetical protein
LAALDATAAALAQERAAEAQARQVAEAHRAELEARLAALDATAAALAQERAAEAQARLLIEQRAEELATQLVSVEDAHSVKVQELERAMGALAADRDSLVRRLVEFEQTPAARLQALVVARLTRTRR